MNKIEIIIFRSIIFKGLCCYDLLNFSAGAQYLTQQRKGHLFILKLAYILGGILILRRQTEGGRGFPKYLRFSTRGEGGFKEMST